MNDNYHTYRDIVFINKRFTKTRFNKILLLFCGINSYGKTVIFAVCMINKEDDESYEYAITHFKKSMADDNQPKFFIVERNS